MDTVLCSFSLTFYLSVKKEFHSYCVFVAFANILDQSKLFAVYNIVII